MDDRTSQRFAGEGYTRSGGLSAGVPTVEAPAPSMMSEAFNDAVRVNQRVSQNLNRLEAIADRLFGGRPERLEKGVPTAVPAGQLGELQGAFRDTHTLLTRLDDVTDRLGTL